MDSYPVGTMFAGAGLSPAGTTHLCTAHLARYSNPNQHHAAAGILLGLEQFTIGCSVSAVGEDKRGKAAEAGDALASSMQTNETTRRRSQARRYRQALSALNARL